MFTPKKCQELSLLRANQVIIYSTCEALVRDIKPAAMPHPLHLNVISQSIKHTSLPVTGTAFVRHAVTSPLFQRCSTV